MRSTTCHRCHAAVLRVLDDYGIEATLDTTALSVTGEALAVISGRRTWNVRRSRKAGTDVWRRRPDHIGRDMGGTLHANHTCQPTPTTWTTPPPPARATTEECPF